MASAGIKPPAVAASPDLGGAPVGAATASTDKAPEKKKAPPVKKEWAGTPAKLLAKQAAMEAKTKNAKSADSTRPVSNEGDSARDLHRSALDSL